jgi:RNA polymerase sigma-70 factor (ECF subfamily)
MALDDPLRQLDDLLRGQRGALIATARAEGLQAEDAIECVQEALCTWLRTEREARLPDTPEARAGAAFTMVRNAARNARRRHHRSVPHVPVDDPGHVQLADHDPDAEALLAHAEETVRLRACIASLCTTQRAVVTLRLLEDRSGEDVAAALGLSRAYVDVLVHRAKASLRACMRGVTARVEE